MDYPTINGTEEGFSIETYYMLAFWCLREGSFKPTFGPMAEEHPTLPHLWENDQGIRNRARMDGQLCVWPEHKLIGISSIKACVLNSKPLTLAAEWWTRQQLKPAAIPIKLIRKQAGLKLKRVCLVAIPQNLFFIVQLFSMLCLDGILWWHLVLLYPF